MACVPPTYGDPFLSGILNYIDCQTIAIAGSGYQGLADTAGLAAPLLLAMLTLYVAGIGLHMLAGQAPSMSDLTMAVLKVGVALTLATSWVAYRAVVNDPVLKGPSEVTSSIGRSSGLPATDGSLVDQLQSADDAIVRLTDLGAGRLDRALPTNPDASSAVTPSKAPLADDLAFGFARIAFLAGVIGTLGVVRLVSGVALALAPIFAGLLLFETTRGLFIGWVRLLLATAFGALLASLILAVELAVLLPWLNSVIVQREGYYATNAAPIELLALTVSFSIILFGAVSYGVRAAFFSAPISTISKIIDRQFDIVRDRSFPPETPKPSTSEPNTSADRVLQITNGLTATSPSNLAPIDLRTQHLSGRGDRHEALISAAGDKSAQLPLGQRYRSSASRVVTPSTLTRAAP